MIKILHLIIIILISCATSQECFGVPFENTNVCSSHGACVENNVCSCYSGFDGAQCENQASPTQCTWNTISLTKTDYYPMIETNSLEFVSNTLLFSILAPLVTDRLNTTIHLGVSTNANCQYPGSYSTNSLDLVSPCYNKFSFSIPWNVASSCGWTSNIWPTETSYTSTINIHQIENIGFVRDIPIQRTISRSFPIEIRFQTQVQLTTRVKIYAPVNMITAVTRQYYISGPPNSGLFDIMSSLQYPFIIDTMKPYNVTGTPVGLITDIYDLSSPFECPTGSACVQRFRLPISVNGACSFTGDYEINLKLGCHSSITNLADCPLDSENLDARIILTANSEDFCTLARVDIQLNGVLVPYSDSTYLTPRNTFLMNEKAYFQAKIFSPKATLLSSTIFRAQWTDGNVTKVLFDNEDITTEGYKESFALGPNGAYTAAFNFLLKPDWMSVELDSFRDFNISAVIKVQYEAVSGATSIWSSFVHNTWSSADLNRVPRLDKKKISSEGLRGIPDAQRSKFSHGVQVFGMTSNASIQSIPWWIIILLSIFQMKY